MFSWARSRLFSSSPCRVSCRGYISPAAPLSPAAPISPSAPISPPAPTSPPSSLSPRGWHYRYNIYLVCLTNNGDVFVYHLSFDIVYTFGHQFPLTYLRFRFITLFTCSVHFYVCLSSPPSPAHIRWHLTQVHV